jgi:hypothetical protein
MPTINGDEVKTYNETQGNGPSLWLTHRYSSTSAKESQIQALADHHKLVL